MIDRKMIRHNWAILNMRDELPIKPIPLRAINNNSELPPEIDGEIALFGRICLRPRIRNFTP